MENAGLSKAQLARDIGVSNAHVANWLSGQLPRAEHLLTISRRFQVTIEWLICGEGPAPPRPVENGHLKQAKAEAEKLARQLGEAEETARRLRVFLG
jgi:transcriptional regulator with XRE-family HTH domain